MASPAPSPAGGRGRFLFRLAALSVLALLATVVLGNHLASRGVTWAWGGIKCGDLVQHYTGGLMWKEGRVEDLYRGFHLGGYLAEWRRGVDPASSQAATDNFNYVYSPLNAALSAWATRWDYAAWAGAWLGLLLGAHAATYLFLRRADPGVFTPDFDRLVLFFGFPSFYFALVPGQNTALTLWITAGSVWCLARGRPVLAGIVFSCACYKPQLMPAVAVFMAAAGHWRFVFALVAGNLAWLGAGLLVCGWEAHRLWLLSLSDMASGVQFQKPGMNSAWTGLFFGLFPGHKALVGAGGLALSLAAPAAVGWWLRRRSGGGPWSATWSLPLALTVWLASASYVGYYEVLLGVPWWLGCIAWRRPGPRHLALLALFWLCAWLAVSGPFLRVSPAAPFLTLWAVASLRAFLPSPQLRPAPGSDNL